MRAGRSILVCDCVCQGGSVDIRIAIQMDDAINQDAWDVVVIGGGVAGAATAYRILRKNAALRVLVVDRGDPPGKKIGESTVEVSTYFLGRTLGLTEYLTREHVIKQGLRFWFSNADCQTLEDCSEIGPGYHVNLPAYQVDRTKLDDEILRRAVAVGAQLLRPARVKQVRLQPGGEQVIDVKVGEATRTLSARWVVDASGPACFLARQEKWIVPNERHPTGSVWARFKGVKNWDDSELRERFPKFSQRCHGSRNSATNHVMGDGWWSWWILLASGEMSIGVVYDTRIEKFSERDGSLEERLMAMLQTSPVAREMLADAEIVPKSVVYRGNLPYHSKSIAGDGYILVGDAAGFLDPFYSPGLDWVAFTTSAALDLITSEAAQMDPAKSAADIDKRFLQSYHRWFEAIYEGKYIYKGDFELMRMAFVTDLAGYYFGMVMGIYKKGESEMSKPVFATAGTTVPFLLIRQYNRRLVKMALDRRRRGVFGRKNNGHAVKILSYTLDWKLPVRLIWSLRVWLWLEVTEGWRTWFRPVTLAGQDGNATLQRASDG